MILKCCGKMEMNFIKYSLQLPCKASIAETENEFVDMGYMQAIDNITAIEAVKLILEENNLTFNKILDMGIHKVLTYYI